MNNQLYYEWSTHQPLIQATMEYLNPKFVLELGIGENSTPLFINDHTELLCVESNIEWLEHIKTKYKMDNILFHGLGEKVLLGTHYEELSLSQVQEIKDFYGELKIPNKKPNLLFVDQYTSCRMISMNALGEKFDAIIYHDCQPDGIPWYTYDQINIQGFKSYLLKTPTAWTSLMLKSDIPLFSPNLIHRYINEYLSQHQDCAWMKFE